MKYIAFFVFLIPVSALSQNINHIEELIVTAQKREQSIQDIPISVVSLTEKDLSTMQIYSLSDLNGVVPALNIQPLGNAATTLTLALRGHAPDPSQITREGSVGVYIDGVYMSRPQGMGTDLADPQRIEVLRGPQGTLFGRNTVGGAVNIISKKPTGKLGVTQILEVGNYSAVRSITRMNLPSINGIKIKLNYIHNEFGGWVENPSAETDFTEQHNKGGRLSLHYDFNNNLFLDYTYDNLRFETGQYYFQLHKDNTLNQTIGNEPTRQHKARYPITLKPTLVKKYGHTLNTNWEVSTALKITSITAVHETEQNTNNNYGGVLNFSGLIDAGTIDHKQLSQELQFIGTLENIEWIAGLYYFEEDAEQAFNTQISLDPMSNPLVPTIVVDNFKGETKAKSKAIFGQITLTPPTIKQLQLTLGARYTDDNRSGKRTRNPNENFDINSDSTDPMIALSYDITDNVSSYIKWSNAYKAVGYNLRSITFKPFKTENIETTEIGLKSIFLNDSATLNIASFTSVFENMQLDFIHPIFINNPETSNARDDVRISGVEIDFTIAPTSSLTIAANYTYLATDKHKQPNPLNPKLSQVFYVTQAPEHAGALLLDYQIVKNLKAHINITSTDSYAHVTFEPLRLDAYTLVNAALTFTIPTRKNSFEISMWGKNITDEEYITNGFSVGNPLQTITHVFGDPKTYGITASFIY